MPWVRIDDRLTEHPKILAAGPLAIAMQVAGLCYCNRELTDGFIPRAKARTLLDWQVERADGRVYEIGVASGMTGVDVDCQWVIDVLVEAGMWEEVAGGYRIHDYEQYQPTKAQIVAEREATAKRQEEWRARHKTSNAVTNATSNGVTNDVTNASNNDPVTGAPKPKPVVASTKQQEPPLVPPDEKPKRRHRLPEGWEPSDRQRESLAAEGYSRAEIDAELIKFRNHHGHKGDTGVNWALAFTNWMLKSREFGRSAPPGNGTSGAVDWSDPAQLAEYQKRRERENLARLV